MSAGDNWCTDQRELDIVASICGVREWDLDPASNPHSRVLTRVSCHGGPALARLPVLPFSTYPGGRVRAKVDGTSFVWPANWSVWNNPPYSDPAPWVAQMIWHAVSGGRGSAILPGCLDTFWGQAVLKARVNAEYAMRAVLRTGSARNTAAGRAFEELDAGHEAAGAPCEGDLIDIPRPNFPIYVERQGMPHRGTVVRIHRPHLLGNPWSHKKSEIAEHVDTVAEALDRYTRWLNDLSSASPEGQELIRLADMREPISLVCFCAPDPCHGDVLARCIRAIRQARAKQPWQVLMLRRRVSFRDPLRPYIGPVPGNRGSSMLLFWGFDPLTCDPNLGEWL